MLGILALSQGQALVLRQVLGTLRFSRGEYDRGNRAGIVLLTVYGFAISMLPSD
jgi:hypothetical protein